MPTSPPIPHGERSCFSTSRDCSTPPAKSRRPSAPSIARSRRRPRPRFRRFSSSNASAALRAVKTCCFARSKVRRSSSGALWRGRGRQGGPGRSRAPAHCSARRGGAVARSRTSTGDAPKPTERRPCSIEFSRTFPKIRPFPGRAFAQPSWRATRLRQPRSRGPQLGRGLHGPVAASLWMRVAEAAASTGDVAAALQALRARWSRIRNAFRLAVWSWISWAGAETPVCSRKPWNRPQGARRRRSRRESFSLWPPTRGRRRRRHLGGKGGALASDRRRWFGGNRCSDRSRAFRVLRRHRVVR